MVSRAIPSESAGSRPPSILGSDFRAISNACFGSISVRCPRPIAAKTIFPLENVRETVVEALCPFGCKAPQKPRIPHRVKVHQSGLLARKEKSSVSKLQVNKLSMSLQTKIDTIRASASVNPYRIGSPTSAYGLHESAEATERFRKKDRRNPYGLQRGNDVSTVRPTCESIGKPRIPLGKNRRRRIKL
jgi:hypothetical protein